ncbi:SusC/RagA family TonB-linked outer membrane protein [Flagellimonas iocasae]|uniref:SusC/RagA family TonB-linked outer membrane protein n=1 Tax=Flagellimonas iocasae TaxID=2055905 RepID=A0ABW4Y0L0_9FLAO
MKKSLKLLSRKSLFLLFCLFLLVLIPEQLMAGRPMELPQAIITGKIADGNGFPLAGVNVIVESTDRGTISDLDGSFRIQVDLGETLIFSIVGFRSLYMPIEGTDFIDVVLEEDVTQLGEVVLNAGYYTVSERERTGSIEKVESVAIEKQPISNPLAALQGRMAGVEIEQSSGLPGANFNIRIRGRNSIRSDGNEPLYIVDGVPYASSSIGESQASIVLRGGAISPLNNINPSDIESIEVLKDADATAIYGSRGANGVVLITTKKGSGERTKVELDVLTGMGRVGSRVDLMGTADYLAMRREGYANDGVTEYPANAYDVNGTWDQDRETDWQKVFFGKTSYLTNVQGSISGGDAQTQFLVSGNYHAQTSVFPGDYKNDKISVLANLGHRTQDGRFSVQLSTSYTANGNHLPGDGFLVSEAFSLAPNAPELYNDDGTLNWENSTWTNPLANFEKDYESKASTLISNAVLGYKIVGPLEFKANLGYTESHLTEINTTPSTIYDPIYEAGPRFSSLLHNRGKRVSWLIEPQLDYGISFHEFTVKALVGLTFQEQKSERLSQLATGFTSNRLIENLSAASDFRIYSDTDQQYRYQAVYGRVNLGLRDRYYLNLTGRRDGSSRFGTDRRFADFGAIGVAWLFTEEELIAKGLPFLSFGKIRASYGTSGSDQIGDYQYLDTYSLGSQMYEGVNGLSPTRLFNPDYSWENNKKLEFAIDLGLFGDRIFMSGSHYRNRTTNQLVGIPLPATTGFASINGNLPATVENTGWEFGLNTVNIKSGRFRWDMSLNLTLPKNRLVAFPDLESSTYANQLVIGESLDIVKRYQFDGVDPQTGLYSFKDLNGDGEIMAADDRRVMDYNPKYYGGWANQFSWGKMDIEVLFQFTKQIGQNILSTGTFPGRMANQPMEVLDRWQQVGDDAAFQRFSVTDLDVYAAFQRLGQSDAATTDASFIRLKNLSITYRVLEKAEKGFGCRLFLRGQNLFTWTDYLGLDPETANPLAIPSLRMLSIGTHLTF